jgi:hypothetical protein
VDGARLDEQQAAAVVWQEVMGCFFGGLDWLRLYCAALSSVFSWQCIRYCRTVFRRGVARAAKPPRLVSGLKPGSESSPGNCCACVSSRLLALCTAAL